MSKSSHYYISGVWKDAQDRITDVMLHTVTDNDSFQLGVKTSESTAINLLKLNRTIKTITC